MLNEEYLERVYLVVCDSDDASSIQSTEIERMQKARVWQRLLQPIVPEIRLPDAFDRAYKDHSSNYPINSYEIKNAWQKIEAEERAESERRAAEEAAQIRENEKHKNCPLAAHHNEEILVAYPDPFDRSKTVWLPCDSCRNDAFNQRVAERGKRQAEKFGNEVETAFTPETAVKKVLNFEPREKEIDPTDAQKLVTEHNELVVQIVEAKDLKELLIIFDEGANRFRLPHRANPLWTEKDIRDRIEDYQRILEKKENG